MAIMASLGLFFIGLIIGQLLPRTPMLVLTRMKSVNQQFPEHPLAIPVDAHLVARILHMRLARRLGVLFTFFPILFGVIMLSYGQAVLGMGLFLAGGWTLLNWVLPIQLFSTSNSPWTRKVAEQLQIEINNSKTDASCCSTPSLYWELAAVRCISCRKNIIEIARPDLGRPRSDGKIMGFLRLWITDGMPIIQTDYSEQTTSAQAAVSATASVSGHSSPSPRPPPSSPSSSSSIAGDLSEQE